MSYLKGFTLWLTAFALSVSVFNFLGYDDMGILFHLTSPPGWFLNNHSSFFRRFLSFEEIRTFNYVLNVGFWFTLGLIIDWLRKSKHCTAKEKRNIRIRLGSIALFLVIAIVSFQTFYAYQNSEKTIASVISNYTEYSSEEISYCLNWAAKQEYGKRYINEMELIVKKTNNPELYSTTMMSLSQLKGREAVTVVLQNYGRFSEPYDNPINLQMNHMIIISMLSISEPPDQIKLAVKAAGILRYIEYVEPLENIASNTKDDALRQEILTTIDKIKKDPIPRNPKWDVD